MLASLLADEREPERRRTLIYGLGVLGYEADLPHVVEALSDDNPGVRIEAIWALRELGGAEAAAALRKREPEEGEPPVRQALEWALETVGEESGPTAADKDVVAP